MVNKMFREYNDVITVSELAKMLKIGRNTAYELVRCGTIRSIRVGRQIRLPKDAVIEYIANYRQSH